MTAAGLPDPLPRGFFARDVLDVAPDLLGREVASTAGGRLVRLRLVEVEAYAGDIDPASHAFRGRTPRNAVMFGPAGHAYVYFTYGMHYCVNVVTGQPGRASAVLLRAGVVVAGEDVVRERRPRSSERDLVRGPARLTQALGIDRSWDGTDLCAPGSGLQLLPGEPVPPDRIATGPRVGVAGDGAVAPWRFWVRDCPAVSVYRPAVARRRRAAQPRAGHAGGSTA
jgi:DNA-3-methyladenine glycosylase